MKLRPALLFLATGLPTLLMAQRPTLSPAEAFDRELRRSRLGTWLVLEDEGAAWGAPMTAAMGEEPLVLFSLNRKVVAGGKKADALAPVLRERYGWPKGPHWALLDSRGQVLAEGVTAPTLQSLTAATEHAGLRSRTQDLEEFLRQHPDHLEAQTALLQERMRVANLRTRKVLGPTAGKAAVAASDGPPEPPKALDAETDLKIWSGVVGQVDRLFQGDWREMGWEFTLALRHPGAEHSPAMVALLTRHRGAIEAALQRRPNAPEPWLAWLAGSRICGGWPLLPLLQSLQPLPGTGPESWPPAMALNEYVKDARARKDWSHLREVLEARWEDMKLWDSRMGVEGLWNSHLSPLVEAMIALGDGEAADRLVAEALALDGWTGLPAKARDLATRLNRPDLATRWGALSAKGR